MGDPFDLTRFVDAQAGIYEQALQELTMGRKRSHWMWFVFPQIAGLGTSSMAQRYELGGLSEALAYLAHPILGPRLRRCTATVNAITGCSAHEMFGSPDDMKFRSSMILFGRADPAAAEFSLALARYFDGREDERTLIQLDTNGRVTSDSTPP